MITKAEIDKKAKEFGINPTDVEKDYINGWVLNTIYSDSVLADKLILKGGNGLRKSYLPNTRFSKDLDFSALNHVDKLFLKGELNTLCKKISTRTAVSFDTSRTVVKEKNLPIPDVDALEARIYFKGFYNEEKIILKTQLDITEFDKIYLPVQKQLLIHPYSDVDICSTYIRCQKIEEILASKLDTLLHRRKPVDLFDLLYSIIFKKEFPIVRREVITTFLKKSVFGVEPRDAKSQLLAVPLDEFQKEWSTIIAPTESLFDFGFVLSNFKSLISNLFSLAITSVRPSLAITPTRTSFRPRVSSDYSSRLGPVYLSSNDRNTIINAGRNRTLVEILYKGISRKVEPYKLEYRTRKSDNRGLEYFWGYDSFASGESGTTGIRQYICAKIEAVRDTGTHFSPRFEVEF